MMPYGTTAPFTTREGPLTTPDDPKVIRAHGLQRLQQLEQQLVRHHDRPNLFQPTQGLKEC